MSSTCGWIYIQLVIKESKKRKKYVDARSGSREGYADKGRYHFEELIKTLTKLRDDYETGKKFETQLKATFHSKGGGLGDISNEAESRLERKDEESTKWGLEYHKMSGVSNIYANLVRLRKKEEEKWRKEAEDKLRPTNMESV